VCCDEDPRVLQSNETAGKKPRKLNSVGLNPHLFQSLYSANDAGKLADFSASYLAGKPSHRPHLNENNQ
jgi:hypothetical protein